MRLVLLLKEESRSHLEALLLQGDLIEVSLEETKWLWQLLQMAQSRSVTDSSPVGETVVKPEPEEVAVDVETVEEPPAKAARLES